MSRPPAPLPKKLPPVFIAGDLTSLGDTRDRLRRSDIRTLGPGIYADNNRDFTEPELARALCAKYPHLVLSGVNAARVHKMPLPPQLSTWEPEAPMSFVTSLKAARPNPLIDLHFSRIEKREIRTLTNGEHKLRIMSRVRTWLDLASIVPLDYLVAAGDALVRMPRATLEYGRTAPYATLAELETAVAAYPGLPGICRARRALELIRVGSDSVQETRARLATVFAGLKEPSLNVPILDNRGRIVCAPDFWWEREGVVGEYDGEYHRKIDAIERDRAKDFFYADRGLEVFRLHVRDLPVLPVNAPDDVVTRALANSRAASIAKRALRRRVKVVCSLARR